MPDQKKSDHKENLEKFKHPTDSTATDERGGKAVRGWENIDKKGHRKDEGDEAEEREGQKGL